MFEMQMEQKGRQLWVRWIGELDHHMAGFARTRLEERIYQSGCFDVVIDFRELNFMDSAGLGVLLGRYRILKSNGGRLIVFGAKPQCAKVMELSGVPKLIPTFQTIEQAIAEMEVYQ